MTTDYVEDDGFSGPVSNDERVIKGTLLKWNETQGWPDRDGLRPPEHMFVVAVDEVLQMWKDGKAETKKEKPLPDENLLNESIPKSGWERGLNGQPRPPWARYWVVYLIDPATGGRYTYLNCTLGARIAVNDRLRENVIIMRSLRGADVVPLVKLTHAPMETNFGLKHRPEFRIVSWHDPRGPGGLLGKPNEPVDGNGSTTPQITGPTSPPTSTPAAEAASTIGAMGSVSKPTTGEAVDDNIPWR